MADALLGCVCGACLAGGAAGGGAAVCEECGDVCDANGVCMSMCMSDACAAEPGIVTAADMPLTLPTDAFRS